MTMLYDLSRLLDRVNGIEDELRDLGHSTVDGREIPEIRKATGHVSVSIEVLKHEIESRIGDPSNYRRGS